VLIGSLFSGIGGLELGLEAAGLGHTAWQIEADPWCRARLRSRWPHARQYTDVRNVTGIHDAQCDLDECCECPALQPCELLCGGFPCQDISAGNGAGLAGNRSGLWFQFARIAHELSPRWIVIENVAKNAARWVDPVRDHLGQLGYESIPFPLRGVDVGSPQRRARLFIVGHAYGDRLRAFREHASAHKLAFHGAHADGHGLPGTWPPLAGDTAAWANYRGPEPGIYRGPNGLPAGLAAREWRARSKALGNAVIPWCAYVIGTVIRELDARQGIYHCAA
jgi:DNA (cytosine-5)-methyltransferase 1